MLGEYIKAKLLNFAVTPEKFAPFDGVWGRKFGGERVGMKAPTLHLSVLFSGLQGCIGFLSTHLALNLLYLQKHTMAELPGYMVACIHSGKLALLAILVSVGIVLQILACALYNNWWPMLTVITYVLLPIPLLFFAGSDASSLFTESTSGWVDSTKFLTGASAVGSIAIPAILKHAGVIGWGAMAIELSSFFVLVIAIMCYIKMNDNDGYSGF